MAASAAAVLAGLACACAVLAGVDPGAARAQELRLGGGYAPHGPEEGASLSGDLVLASPRLLKPLGAPRPYLGAQLSLDGYTNFAQAGLLWRFARGRLYLDLGAGVAVHDGHLGLPRPTPGFTDAENQRRRAIRHDNIEWDTRAVAHATFAVGLRLSDRWALEVHGQHWSNGQLDSDTHDGADALGLRAAWRF